MIVLLPTLLLGTLLAGNIEPKELKMMTLNMQYHHTLTKEMHDAGLLTWTNTVAESEGRQKDEGLPKGDKKEYRKWHDSKKAGFHKARYWSYPTLEKQVEFVSNILARSQLKSFTADVDVIAVQEGFVPRPEDKIISTEKIMNLLGFDLVVCSSSDTDASASVRDMVYDSVMWVDGSPAGQTHPLPKEILEGTLVNQLYVRRWSPWQPNGNNKVTRTSNDFHFGEKAKRDNDVDEPIFDVDCDDKMLAERSVVSSELVCDGKIVRAMCTHISGGRFEDQYWEQDMHGERASQVAKIAEFIQEEDLKAAERSDFVVSLLAGDYNATPYPSAAMKGYATSPQMKIKEEKVPAFLEYMTSSLKAAVTHGFAFTFYDRRDPTIMLDRFGTAATSFLGANAYAHARDGTPAITGNTSGFGHVIDWIAVKDTSGRGVLPGRVDRIVLTKQAEFLTDKSDNTLIEAAGGKSFTDHNAVKQSFVIGDMALIDEADTYDVKDMSQDTIAEIAEKLTKTTAKVAYVGAPANLDDAKFYGKIASVLNTLNDDETFPGVEGVYVGKPNKMLFEKKVTNEEPIDLGEISLTPDAKQYTVLLTPGGPGARKEAAQFKRQGCRIIALTNSSSAFGRPAWYNFTLAAVEKEIAADKARAVEKAKMELDAEAQAKETETAKACADAAEERIQTLEQTLKKTEALLGAVQAQVAKPEVPVQVEHRRADRVKSEPLPTLLTNRV